MDGEEEEDDEERQRKLMKKGDVEGRTRAYAYGFTVAIAFLEVTLALSGSF